jgi:hypothetical protein
LIVSEFSPEYWTVFEAEPLRTIVTLSAVDMTGKVRLIGDAIAGIAASLARDETENPPNVPCDAVEAMLDLNAIDATDAMLPVEAADARLPCEAALAIDARDGALARDAIEP